MKRQIVFSIFFLCSYSFIQAQDVSKETIQWNASGFKDLDANETVTNACQFITYGSKKIKWIQDNGKMSNDWNVTKINGSWADVSTNGSISYNFVDDPMTGQLTLQRSAGSLTANLIITGGTSDIHLRYTVSSIEKL